MELTSTVHDYAGVSWKHGLCAATLTILVIVVVVAKTDSKTAPPPFTAMTMSPYPTEAPSEAPTTASTTMAPTPISTNKIRYNGGSVLTHPVAFVVWYGNWSSALGQATVSATERFLSSLRATPFNTILSSYYSVNQLTHQRNYISNTVVFGGSTHTPAPTNNSTALSQTNIHQVAANAIVSGQLPYSSQGIYFVLTSPEVSVVGMCQSFCGWHSALTVPNKTQAATVAFAVLATNCPAGCAPPQYFAHAQNGQLTDGLVNIVSHELCESATDPFGDGWVLDGKEMADLCSWTEMSGSLTYNLVLNNDSKFTVQGEWLNVDGNGGGYCALSA